MVRLVIENATSRLEGALHPSSSLAKVIKDDLREALSYEVKDKEWSPKFKEGTWDGRISLFHRGECSFPTGLISRAKAVLKEHGVPYTVEDLRERGGQEFDVEADFRSHDRELRPYQADAVEAAMTKGRGVIAMATGGGKTMTACELIARMAVSPVVFVVPSKTLMWQTQREFQKYLKVHGKPAKVGVAGDGVCDLVHDGINVVTWQTSLGAFNERYTPKGDKVIYDEFTGLPIKKTTEQLEQEYKHAFNQHKQADSVKDANGRKTQAARNAKKVMDKAKARLDSRLTMMANKKAVRRLIRSSAAFIVDEAHTAAVVIQRLGEHASKAWYRFGVTATPWREDNQEIRIEGTFGRKCIEITPTYLIERGYLVPPHIFQVKIRHLETHGDYTDAYEKHVTKCWERNWRIKQFAEALFAQGRAVLILVERLAHGEELEKMVENSVFVPGKDDGSGNEDITEEVENYRLEMLKRCGERRHILIATQWANVGVDEPAISALILAGSCQSSVTTFQQVGRVLRPAEGKEDAVIIDFMDEQEDLHAHALRRKRAYKLEPAFKYRLVR